MLAGADELLGQHRAHPRRPFDRPRARRELARPLEKSSALMLVGFDADLADHRLAGINRSGGVGPPVRVDPNHEHGALQAAMPMGWTAAGKPDAGYALPFLFRATPRQDLTGSRFDRKPTDLVAGHSRDTPVRPPTLRTRRAVHRILYQGIV